MTGRENLSGCIRTHRVVLGEVKLEPGGTLRGATLADEDPLFTGSGRHVGSEQCDPRVHRSHQFGLLTHRSALPHRLTPVGGERYSWRRLGSIPPWSLPRSLGGLESGPRRLSAGTGRPAFSACPPRGCKLFRCPASQAREFEEQFFEVVLRRRRRLLSRRGSMAQGHRVEALASIQPSSKVQGGHRLHGVMPSGWGAISLLLFDVPPLQGRSGLRPQGRGPRCHLTAEPSTTVASLCSDTARSG